MNLLVVGIYARVSSEQQAQEGTIDSQVAELRERVKKDGFELAEELEFIDEGYSGATLVRPGLERLRDLAAAGGIERVYVLSPYRLARKYAYQVLLLDEFARAGVEMMFLNHPLGESPEDELLVQVQGMIAEYERAKILERSRRGKRHAARQGSVSVLGAAPYGYRYVKRSEEGAEARFEVIEEEARVVRQVYNWVAEDRVSIGEACRRLAQAGELSPRGKSYWDRTTVWGMLKNPTYKGMAAYGKTRVGPVRSRLRVQRNSSEQPRRAYSVYDVPQEEWIHIPVSSIVGEEVFEAVQEQLGENRQRARQRKRGARYLLQGLLVCSQCGYAFYGKPVSRSTRRGKRRHYAYYRCIGTDAYRFGGERICYNKQVRTDRLDQSVWDEVEALLREPERLEEEYRRRLKPGKKGPRPDERQRLVARLGRVRTGIARLIDSYADGLIEKSEFEPRVKRARERVSKLEEQVARVSGQVKCTPDGHQT